MPLVRQRVAAGVPQHVRVRLEAQLCLGTRPLDHAGEASSRERCSALRHEDEGRFGRLLTLEAP